MSGNTQSTNTLSLDAVPGPGEYRSMYRDVRFERGKRDATTVELCPDGSVYIEFDNGDRGYGAMPNQAVSLTADEVEQVVAVRAALKALEARDE